jgi:hypothetical protein
MEGHGARLNRKMESVIAALLTQRNQEEAERAVDISPATLLRWLKLPEFQKAYREARRAAHDQSIARLQQGTSAAVSTLLKVMVDPTTLASTKVRAADSVLDHSAKSIELEDIDARVARLKGIHPAGGAAGLRRRDLLPLWRPRYCPENHQVAGSA